MPYDHDREQLISLLRKFSIRFGDFVLASGQRSDVYVDAKLTTYRAEAMPLIGRIFLEAIRRRGWNPSAVGGLTLGADPIAMSIARESLETGLTVDCFVVRKEPKKHGLMKFIEGLPATAGVNVVIIDDVCTTGGSTKIAIERAREEGLNVLGAICLVDREMGARENLEGKLASPFEKIFTLSELSERCEASSTG
jgi:orotate phosphoribosyltransferase